MGGNGIGTTSRQSGAAENKPRAKLHETGSCIDFFDSVARYEYAAAGNDIKRPCQMSGCRAYGLRGEVADGFTAKASVTVLTAVTEKDSRCSPLNEAVKLSAKGIGFKITGQFDGNRFRSGSVLSQSVTRLAKVTKNGNERLGIKRGKAQCIDDKIVGARVKRRQNFRELTAGLVEGARV